MIVSFSNSLKILQKLIVFHISDLRLFEGLYPLGWGAAPTVHREFSPKQWSRFLIKKIELELWPSW